MYSHITGWLNTHKLSQQDTVTRSSIHPFTEKHPEQLKADCGPTAHRQKTQKTIILAARGHSSYPWSAHELWKEITFTVGNLHVNTGGTYKLRRKRTSAKIQAPRTFLLWWLPLSHCGDVKWSGKKKKKTHTSVTLKASALLGCGLWRRCCHSMSNYPECRAGTQTNLSILVYLERYLIYKVQAWQKERSGILARCV